MLRLQWIKILFVLSTTAALAGYGLAHLFRGKEGHTASESLLSNSPDSIQPPPNKEFSWWVAADKQIWLNIARSWYGYDTLIAAAMCDSFVEKSRIAWEWMPEVEKYGLPDSSIFFEYLDLHHLKSDRALVLWVDHPRVSFSTDGAEWGCASSVLGWGAVQGNSALLLLDTRRKMVLQRLDSIPGNEEGMGFGAPFASEAGGTYHCSALQNENYDAWGIATVLYPHDLNRDGLAAEFLFYYYIACGVHDCAVIAYDPARDKLLQRPFRLKTHAKTWPDMKDTFYVQKSNWVLQFPLDSVEADGRIRYYYDVGHGCYVTYHFDFKFDHNTGLFEGSLREQPIID